MRVTRRQLKDKKLSICLNMIVRDEEPVISRCLDSVIKYIDYWVIVDTGSTDKTAEIIQSELASIPGEIHHRTWVDFGHNRTEAMELARSKADYILIMDADNIFKAPEGWSWPKLSAGSYNLLMRSSGTEYRQRLLVSDQYRWRWEGVLHEYLVSEPDTAPLLLEGPWIDRRHEGARSRDPNTYRKDAALLESALAKQPDHHRYAFYLAQSWRDAREPDKALSAYRHRATMGGWEEEVFFSLYQCGTLLEQLGRWLEALEAYLKSWQYRQTRAEPLYRICRHYRIEGDFALGYFFGLGGLQIPWPSQDILFVDAECYRWRLKDELAICAYYLGKYNESFQLGCELLRVPEISEPDRDRLLANRDFSVPHLLPVAAHYPQSLINQIQQRTSSSGEVTLTITSCKRLDLFKITVNSFLNCCRDLTKISRWICIDDNSSEEDRVEMQRLYPFFEFIFKDESEKGHARSMNRLIGSIETPYWLALEDDWHFFVPAPYIEDALEIMMDDESIGQVLFNRNYGLILEHRSLIGGSIHVTKTGRLRYRVQDYYDRNTGAFDEFMKTLPPGGRTNAWWPHYSLHPSLVSMKAIRRVGQYDEQARHFELEFAERYTKAGLQTAFLDSINVLHIGKQPWDRAGDTKNAYQLNGQKQFS